VNPPTASAAGTAAPDLKPDSEWRCAQCGVSSTERSCFIVPERFSKPPHYVRCLTCEQRRLTPGAIGGIRGAVSVTLFPVVMLLGLGGAHGWSPWLFLICAVLYPIAIIAHEAGHAVMGGLLGLELGGVGIGYGPVVWKFGIRGLPVQIHAWPFSGRVFLGASSLKVLRTRLWLATLMGPVVNVLLAVGAALWWDPLESLWGTAVVALWFTVNVILVLSLSPTRDLPGMSLEKIMYF
jgi:hypothetical protein